MRTLHFTTRTTAEIIRGELEVHFPGVRFDVTVDMPAEPFGPGLALVGIIVRWPRGPSRGEVEAVVSHYQGLEWNPETGILEENEHMEVTDEGELRRLRYGVDYVFVEGPGDDD